jgi:DNA invertase Pin-like site-specific DNA recombinase
MNPKITADHLARAAIVYVRQSTMAQVVGNLESQRRQYDLAGAARATGFASVKVIDDDLGRSGSGTVERPGFERLVAMVCSGGIGAVYCIEASRLARNGRDWHHLIELCALAGTLVVDPEGAYDPQIVNDRLLLGLKGTMSEYELSLMRQRGLAARDSKARRGEFQFMLPPGFCWSEAGKIEIDPDEHVQEAVRMVFAKFRELGSARQTFLWFRTAQIKMPVVRRNANLAALDRRSCGSAQRRSRCLSCAGTSTSARSSGSRPPITPSCRSCTTRCTREPMRSAGGRSAPGSSTGAPTR